MRVPVENTRTSNTAANFLARDFDSIREMHLHLVRWTRVRYYDLDDGDYLNNLLGQFRIGDPRYLKFHETIAVDGK